MSSFESEQCLTAVQEERFSEKEGRTNTGLLKMLLTAGETMQSETQGSFLLGKCISSLAKWI